MQRVRLVYGASDITTAGGIRAGFGHHWGFFVVRIYNGRTRKGAKLPSKKELRLQVLQGGSLAADDQKEEHEAGGVPLYGPPAALGTNEPMRSIRCGGKRCDHAG